MFTISLKHSVINYRIIIVFFDVYLFITWVPTVLTFLISFLPGAAGIIVGHPFDTVKVKTIPLGSV